MAKEVYEKDGERYTIEGCGEFFNPLVRGEKISPADALKDPDVMDHLIKEGFSHIRCLGPAGTPAAAKAAKGKVVANPKPDESTLLSLGQASKPAGTEGGATDEK